ncbi:hypothetical protein NC652_014638 [Populus alba x Populus x berolinensis]|nr:hypothetical protein NC652_014638 [Populus alba x Populus x berolinensis]
MESETASSVDEQVSGGGGGGGGGGTSAGADTRGKHRILAELKRVEQEIKFLEITGKLFFFSMSGHWLRFMLNPADWVWTGHRYRWFMLRLNCMERPKERSLGTWWEPYDFIGKMILSGWKLSSLSMGRGLLVAQNVFLSHAVQINEELEELEKTDNVSTVCEELLRNMENIPDPLLSLTNGPANPLWDRWFEGPQKSQGCVCRIL